MKPISVRVAHVLDESGVTSVVFRRDPLLARGREVWTSAEPFNLPPGGVLCFGLGYQPIVDLIVWPHETLTVEFGYRNMLADLDLEDS